MEAAEELRCRGNDLFRSGDHQAALIVYSQALQVLAPSCVELRAQLLSNRAACHLEAMDVCRRRGDDDDRACESARAAAHDCNEALELTPQYVKALYRRARARKALGDLDGARSDIAAVLVLEPTHQASRTLLSSLELRSTSSSGARVPEVPLNVNVTPVQPSREAFKKGSVSKQHIPLPLRHFSYHPSADGVDSNIVVYLHGVGDSHEKFGALGRQMGLPQTSTLAIRAHLELPLDLGYWWFPAPIPGLDEVVDASVLALDACVDALGRTVNVILKLIDNLHRDLGYPHDGIFLYGYSQGACTAVAVAHQSRNTLGGVVGVSLSELPILRQFMSETMVPDGKMDHSVECKTPILLTHGGVDRNPSCDDVLSLISSMKDGIEWPIDFELIENKDHSMVNSRVEAESRVIMEFFADRLRRRHPALESSGVYQVRG